MNSWEIGHPTPEYWMEYEFLDPTAWEAPFPPFSQGRGGTLVPGRREGNPKRGIRRVPDLPGLELHRDAAEDPAVQRGVGAGEGGRRAAAELHVELQGPLRGQVPEEAQVLGEHKLQPVEVGRRHGRGRGGEAERQLSLGQVVKRQEDAG